MEQPPQVRLGDIRDAVRIAGISKSEIHRRVADGTFPKPIRFAPRCTRYPLHEIEQWVVDRLAERDQPKPAAPQRARLSA